jgi:predicted transglutaminase-like cysteine proteinase
MQWNNVALGKARAEKEMQAKEIEGVPINNASALEKNNSNTTTTATSSGQLTKQQLKELMA